MVNMKKLRKFHSIIAIVVVAYVLMATLSGMLHIIVSYSKPPTPTARAAFSPSFFEQFKEIKKPEKQNENVTGITLKEFEGAPWWQVTFTSGAPIYFHGVNLTQNEGMDKKLAMGIAQEVNAKDKIKSIDYVEAFNHEYMSIFRILPVYRVEFENAGKEVVFVSTATGGVTLYTNKYKKITSEAFSMLHKFSFIHHKPVRDVIQMALLLLIVVMSVTGVVLFKKTWRSRT